MSFSVSITGSSSIAVTPRAPSTPAFRPAAWNVPAHDVVAGSFSVRPRTWTS